MRRGGVGRHAPTGAGCESWASWSFKDRSGKKVGLYGDMSRERRKTYGQAWLASVESGSVRLCGSGAGVAR